MSFTLSWDLETTFFANELICLGEVSWENGHTLSGPLFISLKRQKTLMGSRDRSQAQLILEHMVPLSLVEYIINSQDRCAPWHLGGPCVTSLLFLSKLLTTLRCRNWLWAIENVGLCNETPLWSGKVPVGPNKLHVLKIQTRWKPQIEQFGPLDFYVYI